MGESEPEIVENKSHKRNKGSSSPEERKKSRRDADSSDESRKPRRDKSKDRSRKNRSKSPKSDKHTSDRSPDGERHKRRRSRSKDRRRSRSSDRRRPRKYQDLDKPQEEYQRYYGDDKRENNDRYWSKYPKRDENVIGTRYYDVEKPKDKESDKDNEKEEGEIDSTPSKSTIPAKQRKTVDLLTSKTGGAYIPPAKLRMMQAEITDKSSAAYQRIAWEALKKSIHGHINKINTSNIKIISYELLHENIVRGRGLLCKSIIQAQAASPTFTNVYAALVAVINSKFPNIGELLLKRLVLQFKRGFKQNNKMTCISGATFVAHLVNQRVSHEILALEILTLLVESPTDDSVEVAIAFLKECGQKLTEVSSKGINAIFEMLRNILHEGQLEKRIQYMIEVMFQVRKDGFKDHAAITEELDIVEEEDQFTHLITLDDVKQSNSEDVLNVFKFDENYQENEGKYKALSKEILDSDSSDSGSGESGSEEEDSDDEDGNEDDDKPKQDMIIDNTETNLIALRRTIYLTIQSSLDFEECAHKLMKMELKPGQEIELCHMFLDCCAEQRTYEKFYGLLAQRFCQINNIYVGPFEQIFRDTYGTTHRLDANRLRNVSKFFGHLLFTDAIGWDALNIINLNEQETNSSSRIFIKILFQELAEYMGLGKLNTRLKDQTMQESFIGLFPRDNPKNTRFAINFFTTIGLGGLTDELREHLTSMPKVTELPTVQVSSDTGSSSSSSSSSSSDSSSSSSSDSSSESEDDKSKKKKKKNKNLKKRKDKDTKEKSKRQSAKTTDRKSREKSIEKTGRDNQERPRNDRHDDRNERYKHDDRNGRPNERQDDRNERHNERQDDRNERRADSRRKDDKYEKNDKFERSRDRNRRTGGNDRERYDRNYRRRS